MAQIIEARAVISAQDKTAGVFDKLAKKLDGIGKASKMSKHVDEMARSLDRARSQMSAIDKFDLARGALPAARQKFREMQAAVESAARAMAATAAPTKDMERNFRRAQEGVKSAARAFEFQRDAVISHKRALEGMGIKISEAAQHQVRLHKALEQTNAALRQQGTVTQRNARLWDHTGVLGTGAAVAAGAVSAASIGHGIKHAVVAGAHYRHEAAQLENVGRTPQEMKAIEAASKATSSRLPTASYTENLKVLSETTGAFGSLAHAIENLDFMQKSNAVVHSAAGDKVREGPGEMGNKMARFFEMRGSAGDPHVFQSEAEKMVRAMVFTRGNFNPSEMLNFGQQAKGALQNYSMEFLGNIAPSLITEMGGDGAGTGANAWRNTLMGKVRDQKQTAEWVKLGLLDPKLVAGGKGGAPQSWRAGAVKDTNTALKNPLEWTEKTLIPALQGSGVNVDDPLELSKALGTMFRNQNANQFAEQITQLRARTRLHKDNELMGHVKPLDEMYQHSLKTDPTQSITALTASLDNLATTVTSPAMQGAAGVISGIAGSFQSLAGVLADHPATAVTAGVGVAGGSLAAAGFLSYKLATGFGLSTSAAALDVSAGLLSQAAVALNAGKLLPGGLPGGAPGKSIWSKIGTGLKNVPVVGSAVAAGEIVMEGIPAYQGAKQQAGTWGLPGAQGARVLRGGKSVRQSIRDQYGDIFAGNDIANGRAPPLVSPTMTYGMGVAGDRHIDVKGDFEGEVTFKNVVEAGSELIRVVQEAKELTQTMRGQLRAQNGPGSTGRSSPDAAPFNAGSGKP